MYLQDRQTAGLVFFGIKMNQISKILLITISLLLNNCKAEDNPMKIITYKNGQTSEVKISNDEGDKVKTILSDLLAKTDDMLRVHFDEDRINGLKLQENCIEIVLDSTQKFTTGFLGDVVIKKVLLPLSGDYQASEKIDIVTIIIGEDEYSSGPLTASGGFKLLEELKGIVFNKN